ncbi:protein FAM205A-like [Talpa occidentalis]|uniref:protein FAM205A-like n=1 Tax=Talpa occidentalis TaxID=50954 RepID=UPI00188F6B81|nr:protein FAM205A-like [Talpa occidentalis]
MPRHRDVWAPRADEAKTMWSPTFLPWDGGYHLYTYGSVLLMILIIWKVKRSYHGLRLEPKKCCCQRHRKVKQRARDAGASRARGCSRKEAEKPRELLSVMKSQDWLPREGGVRRLLCADPCCNTCNAVALDIKHLLEGGSLTCPCSVGPPQGSPCLDSMAMPSKPVEQCPEHQAHCSKQLPLPLSAPVAAQFSDQKSFTRSMVQSPTAVSIHDYWTEHLQLTQQIQGPEVPRGPENMCVSVLEEPRAPVTQQLTGQTNSSLSYENQGQQPMNSQVSLLTVNQEITTATLTDPVPLHMDTVLPANSPILSPDIQRLLEVHVKKWMHFQRWGLPRRVEESMRQHMPNPPLFCQPENSEPGSPIHCDSPNFSVENLGTVSYQTWGSCLAGQATQAFWISEWAINTADQGHRYQQVPHHLALLSPALKDLSGPCALPGPHASETVDPWQQKYSQLFCGLPSLHSESLVANVLGSPGFSLKNSMSKLPLNDPFPFKELSFLPFPPKTPPQPAPPPYPSSPNQSAPSDHPQAHTNIPFLTRAECEALEWHVLQRHLQLQWGSPAVFQRSQHALSPAPHKSWDRAPSPETLKTSWPGQPVSVLTKDILLFPEQARRLLDFHLQRQLIHNRWGLPQKIQQSFQLLLSIDQQPLAWRSAALASEGVSREPAGTVGPFPPFKDPVPVPMPHLFAQAQEILQNHIDSKCGQIQQEKVPLGVGGSWECETPGGQTCSPESEPSELQAASDPDQPQKDSPLAPDPTPLDQQQQASPEVVAEHPKVPQALSKGAIEKLETTLRHKYLAFLSGLPALYYVALSMAMTPETAPQDEATDSGPRPAQTPPAPLTQITSSEEPCLSPEPGFQGAEETSEDAAEEVQAEAHVEETEEPEPLESQSEPPSPIVNKLNFHLRKKTLEIQLGIPTRAKESREHGGATSENASTWEALASPHDQRNTSPQELPLPPDSPRTPDPGRLSPRGQLASPLQAGQQSQTQPSSRASSPGSAHWASKVAQPTEDMTKAQVLCVRLEAGVNDGSLEKPWGPEAQSPDKCTDWAPAPEVAEKREKPGKPKPAGGHGEGDAGLALSSTREENPHAEAPSPVRTLLSRTRSSLWRRSHRFHLDASCPPSPQHRPLPWLPEQAPRMPGAGESAKDDPPHSPTKGGVILKPARMPQNARPVVPRASQGPPLQGKLLPAQTLQGQLLQGQVMPVHSHKRPSLPESGLRNKIKSFLNCINPKPKAKGHEYSMPSTVPTVAQTRKGKAEKILAPAKSPLGHSKTQKIRGGPKATALLPGKQAAAACSGDLLSPHSKFRHRLRTHSRKPHLASVLGRPPYCPRHCPQGVNATQPGNPP